MGMPDNPTTKDKIFFAAVRLFSRDGYDQATVRDICREAGTANATAVNYYFGSKAKLYKAILDMVFAENLRRRTEQEKAQPSNGLSPKAKLRRFLTIMVEVGFSDHPVAKDITTIVLREMMSPSQHLDDLVEQFTRPDNEELSGIIREILGEDAPDFLIRDSLASVGGQIFYYLAFWPVFSRVYPEHPGISKYQEPLIDHIMRFSMAGLTATRDALEKGEIPPLLTARGNNDTA
ncbi:MULTISPECIES: CerR family C-terminal domain-containing protein [unclassified Pseudodesulfovibrio]|uniref:TetR/AcrR family transcriptional regulator n=1 Tax=unclassified Pseudodesulfovibrio TaxID=2661612 RepID=UPI000FEB87D7|nr:MULTISPECIES: CerR family C-terminal domain-containing protein [unclassified Pseudodesulfovibrio]MCJ2165571.1 CerR family C-terminal domain-containing protein [Pseudodesulfovibrio sp. S3-i]RWU03069.1 TetR/AcrR family transcriptional regulator [Pseudodesulfovibrio sp. S3]